MSSQIPILIRRQIAANEVAFHHLNVKTATLTLTDPKFFDLLVIPLKRVNTLVSCLWDLDCFLFQAGGVFWRMVWMNAQSILLVYGSTSGQDLIL